jgi:hypothetical protein
MNSGEDRSNALRSAALVPWATAFFVVADSSGVRAA